MNIERIREYMQRWALYSFSRGVGFYRNSSVEEKNQAEVILRNIHLWNMNMTGESVQRQQDNYRAHEGSTGNIIYSAIMNNALESDYLTPASYIMDIIRECNDNHIDDQTFVTQLVLRGYRSFPSFIRELDLAAKVADHIENAECERCNPEEDVVGHTDVILRYNENIYRLWSYQDSVRGLNNTTQRFRGERGILPEGIHVLCPINCFDEYLNQFVQICGWKLYSDSYVEKIANTIIDGNIDDYNDVRIQNVERLREYMKKVNMVRVNR